MADGKNIEIKIAATGGDQAAAEVRKVGDAATEASNVTAAGALRLDENVSKIARAEQALALGKLAEEAAKLGRNFREAAKQVETFDKDAAAGLRDTARHVEEVGSSVSTVAAGFATGGPIGSALASLGLLVKALTDKWQDGENVVLKAASNQKAALEKVEVATRYATTAAQERATALSDGVALAAMDAELQKAKAITAEMQRQTNLAREKRQLENEVLSAKDQADLAGVDLDEASGKLTKDQAAEKRADIEAAARKRDRDERKQRVAEDSVNSAGEAIVKTEAAQKARNVADELSQKTTAAEANAKGIADYTSREISKIVPNKKTGELSDSDKKFVADMQAEVKRAENLLSELSKASKEATDSATKAEQEAADARRDAGDKGTRAKETISALDRIQGADDQRQGTQSRVRQTRTAAENKRESDEARQKEQDRQEKAREARREFEGEAAQIGNRAGKAAEQLGARGGVVEGLKRLGTAISKPGDAKGDDKALHQIMGMVESLISHAEAGGKGANPATDDLRGLQERIRKAEKMIGILEQQHRNGRNGR